MAESEEELKSLLMKVKVESDKVGLKACPGKPWTWLPSMNDTVPITGDAGPEVPLEVCFLSTVPISG